LTGTGNYDDFALLGERGLSGINGRIHIAMDGGDELLGFGEVIGREVFHFSFWLAVLRKF